MKNRRKDEAGIAMILVLIAIIVILGALGIVSQMMTATTNNTNRVADIHVVEEACKGGIDFAIERLWNQYVIGNGNTTGNLASYRFFIDGILPANSTVELLDDGPLVIDPATGVTVDSITIERRDTINGIDLAIQALGNKGGMRQRVEQSVRISGQPFAGFEYCVLANNINCILCHAGFYSVDERNNTDPELFGTFDRVKVASLEALLYRTNTADSNVAGSVYTRGNVFNETYKPLSPTDISNSKGFKGFAFSTDDGTLDQDGDGDLIGDQKLTYSGVDGDGRPQPFDSLYTNYPTDPDLMTDGPLPETFPAPYPDDDGDRYIDDSEFEEIADRLNGSVQGGIAYGVLPGDVYDQPALPAASNGAMADLASSGRYDGNVVLVGTDANPIILDGEVAINGDLVIQGKVKGRGQVFVRGNTYITGDVTYADAPGEFGVAADGTENAFGLVTGGSVLMGDYLTIRGKNFSDQSTPGTQYPNSAYSIRAREAHKSKTTKIDGKNETINYGYFDPGVIDAGEIQDTMIDASGNVVPRQGQQFSFTQSELQLFNSIELDKAIADPNYIPRFYGLRETQPDNIYVWTRKTKEEHAVHYLRDGSELLVDHLIDRGIDPNSIMDRAAYHYMNPEDYWMDYETLRQMWWDDEMARTQNSDNSKVRFDGLIYSNNAIFAITRSRARKGSFTQGKMEVRGAFIAPDLGVLVPGPDQEGNESFTMLYDPRVRTFWAPSDTTRSFFERVTYRSIDV